MDKTRSDSLDEVRSVLISVLGIEDRAAALQASTPLLGSVPELDSMAVLELVAALEQQCGITVDDDDVTAELFETVGSLAEFVDAKRG